MKGFFNALNYTIGNEDPSVELEVLPENVGHVFAVAGSGSRVVPLFAKNPQQVTCVDSSIEQLSFAELRISSVKELSHKEFIAFWGYPGESISFKERGRIFESLHISDRARKFTALLFERNYWNPLLYVGKWERAFKKLSIINRMLVGEKGLKLFDCQSKEEQYNCLRTQFPHNAWSASVYLLGNAMVFNALLYKGTFPKKNIIKSMYSFYMDAFRNLFKQNLARNNFFLQLLFFGTLKFREGLPLECDYDVFYKAKNGARDAQIQYVRGDIITEAKNVKPTIDLLSLSDIPSYLGPPREQNFLQDIKDNLTREGIVINRYYLRIPENLNVSGYKNITDNFSEAIMNEKVQMYSFGIYQKV